MTGTLGKKTVKFVKDKYWIFLLALIILVAAGLRFVNIDWDEGAHLHPDERFLSMVTNDIKWPGNVTSYFDTATSPLNPANAGKTFFVYGTFPIFLTKLVGDLVGVSGYGGYPLTGRVLSGFFDLLTIIVIFLIGKELFNTKVGLLSAFFLAITVLHIQHSHFFVVDLFVTFFTVLTFYLLLLFIKNSKWIYVILLGVSLGFAFASKISSILFLLLLSIGLLVIFVKLIERGLKERKMPATAVNKALIKGICYGIVILLLAFLIFKILQPYAFKGLMSVELSNSFKSSMEEIKRLSSRSSASGFVPSLQWLNKSPVFHVKNLVQWGIGLPLSLFCILGILLVGYKLIRKKENPLIWLVLIWIFFILSYYALQFAKTLRYLLPIVPFILLFGAYFVFACGEYAKKWRFAKPRSTLIVILLVAVTLPWTLAFANIYQGVQPRLQASAWIYENVPENSTIGVEPWDDGIPIHLQNKPPPPKLNHISLSLHGQDNDDKLRMLSEQLSNVSFIFITSGRNYKVLPQLPERYPHIKRYYELLFNGTLGFTLEREFTNYPRLFGLEIHDDEAEEAFVVYDHPKVVIFKKEKNLKSEEIVKLIRK